jgi:hypothetical protein
LILGVTLGIAVTGCGSASDAATEVPIGVGDPALVEHVTFGEVTEDSCVADTRAVDGLVAVASCDVAGSIPVQQVTTVGTDAPAERPAEQVVHGYASAACTGAVASYARDRNIPETGLLLIAVISDTEWAGAQTPVVCAVSEAL